MNYLLAKLKGKVGEIKKIISQRNDFLSTPNLNELHDYDPRYNLEKNEWYKISKEHYNRYENPFKNLIESRRLNTANYSRITVLEYEKIQYLCFTSSNHFLFQKMMPSQILKKKWLSISEEPEFENNKKIIILNEYVDAIVDRQSKDLYFKDIGKIKDLFIGIEELYREATQEEVDLFVNQDFLKLTNGYTAKSIKTKNRKLIALVVDKIKDFSKIEKKNQLFNYGKEHLQKVCIEKKQFVIKSESDLKEILYLIDERFYKTTISKEKRLANSVKKMENN